MLRTKLRVRVRRRLAAALLAGGCAPAAGDQRQPPATDAPPAPVQAPAQAPVQAPARALPPAPWRGARLDVSAVPAVYRTQWRKAANRARCALIAPLALGMGVRATPRAATYAGGWAVAYDRPGQRSAFGVAGSGTTAEGAGYAWPDTLRWADGSSAGYGLEGGTGPNHLAYLRIPGQACLYNVWSRLGRAHLRALLAELRFVD